MCAVAARFDRPDVADIEAGAMEEQLELPRRVARRPQIGVELATVLVLQRRALVMDPGARVERACLLWIADLEVRRERGNGGSAAGTERPRHALQHDQVVG